MALFSLALEAVREWVGRSLWTTRKYFGLLTCLGATARFLFSKLKPVTIVFPRFTILGLFTIVFHHIHFPSQQENSESLAESISL
jgi:hypothetical protein